jgi:hypothetical protein
LLIVCNIKSQAKRLEDFTDRRALNSGRQTNAPMSIEDKGRLQDLEIKKLNQKIVFIQKILIVGRIFSLSTAIKRKKKASLLTMAHDIELQKRN